MGNIAISTSNVPEGFCFESWRLSWPSLVALLSGNADLSVNVEIGEAAPADLSKLWFKTISGVPDRAYYFASGVWLAKHPFPTGFTVLAPAGTSLADIDTLDGGEVGAVTAFSGPMWTEDTDFRGVFPIGPGTLPSGLVINEGDTGGEEKHSLTVPEIPAHVHPLQAKPLVVEFGSDTVRLVPTTLEASESNSGPAGGDANGIVVPHQNMPPYLGRYWIKRTGRSHYRA